MSRRKLPYAEALASVLKDVERLDFMERTHGTVSRVDEGFYFSSLGEEGTAHGGYSKTVRGAIDLAMAEVQAREEERRRWQRILKK